MSSCGRGGSSNCSRVALTACARSSLESISVPSRSKTTKSILSSSVGVHGIKDDKIRLKMPAAELLFFRFCLAGPLLYIGLQMIVEPARFVTSVHMLMCVLQNFQHRFEID